MNRTTLHNRTSGHGTSPFATAVIGLMAAALAVGCSTDANGPGDLNGGGSKETQCVVGGGGGVDCIATIEVREVGNGLTRNYGAQVEVPVGNVATGETLDLTFSVNNAANIAGSALLQIQKIRIDYAAASPAEVDGLAFQCYGPDGTTACDGTAFRPIAPAGVSNTGWVNEERFTIRFKRYDDNLRKANVYITLAGDPEYYSKEFLLRFTTKAGSPKINTPELVEFGQVEPDTSVCKDFKILNTGDAVLEVSKIDFLADKVFTLKTKLKDGTDKEWKSGEPIVLDPALSVAPSASHDFKVCFGPKDPNKKQGTLTFVTNDPDPKAGEVPIIANAKVPCMQLEPAGKLSFGGVKLGEPTTRDVRIKACGGADLIVNKIEFGDAGNSTEFSFKFDKLKANNPAIDGNGPSKENPVTIKVNEEAVFEVIYTPEDETPNDPETGDKKFDIAEVKVLSNAFNAKNSVLCEGSGVTSTCPTAKISIKEGEEVIPQTVLHLKGDQSQASGGGSIKKYQWTAKQPGGSNQVFVPGSNFPNPTFTANAAGEYEFCLQVWDQNDEESCAPACVTVLVIPEEAIHVELLWDTPADLNQTDTGPAAGADMDLHFAHYLANGPDIDCDGKPDPWFSNPFDTFWFNPNPNWGNANPNVPDDPSLDLDDTDGAGPENLNLADPEGTAAKPAYYHVGVHYWNDHGFGMSKATVNVYIFGVLAVQIDKIDMDVLDMWYVGKINWPNKITDTAAVNIEPVEICYQNGDPCKGGKRWVPKGDWCITKCYTNPAFTATQSGANPAVCKK
ncbi:MAG: hypothetical protein H6747_06095 [Deltaproteobacteria bacterium]|nr:hypothetical protein [Deltaproteobacteria bacterium]